MRFLELHVVRYGPLVDRSFELQSGVFVVFGPNEAGKSSFHAALQTVLYGFERPSRSDHPLAQFADNDADLELRAVVQLDDDRRWDVHRTLMSYGKVEIQAADGQVVLSSNRNDPLPAIQSIPKQLFEAVYSLTANDTHMQTDGVRDHIQELLLGETGLRGARPLGQVRRQLQDDMQALWRPDNVGKPLAKRLRNELRDATSAQRLAKQADRELLEAHAEQARLQPEQSRLKQRKKELRRQLDRMQYAGEWREFRVRHDAIVAVETRLAELPEAVRQGGVEDPGPLAARLERLTENLVPLRSRVAAEPLAATEQQLRWEQNADCVTALLAGLPERRDLLKDWQHREQLLVDSKEQFAAALRGLGLDASKARALPKLPVAQLLLDAGQWEADLEIHRQRSAQRKPSPWWILWALLGAGCAVAMWGVPAYAAFALAGCLLCFGLALATFLRPTRPATDEPEPALPQVSATALAELGLAAGQVRSPGALTQLANELRRTQDAWRRAREVAQDLDLIRGRIEQLEHAWAPKVQALGLEGSVDQWSPTLASSWAATQAAVAAAQADARERQEAQSNLAKWEAEYRDCQERAERTRLILRTAFPDRLDLQEGFRAWQEHTRRKLGCEQDLERLRGHVLYRPELETSETPHAEQEPGDPASIEELSAQLEETDQELQTLHTRLGALGERLANDTTAHLARATEVVQERKQQLQETLEERDRLALLASVLDRAEADYRKAHQPDVLLRSGEYLRRITDGRYTALRYPEAGFDESKDVPLQVLSTAQGWRTVAKPLSRGTQEQIYLALRLGTLDYLDSGRERLPLVLDEALVHWDHRRRLALYGVLRELCQHRQVILFTCHESFAEEVQAAMDARLISLVE
ncbi:MAG: AAA family ATPase [Planctomycetes bacterium]|nr:AAA family ATPase [Planctomycetota bacterium]HPF13568.1 AAA family ATPase [Planctomycetota bacterium]